MKNFSDYIVEKANFLVKKHVSKQRVFKDVVLHSSEDFDNCDKDILICKALLSENFWSSPDFDEHKYVVYQSNSRPNVINFTSESFRRPGCIYVSTQDYTSALELLKTIPGCIVGELTENGSKMTYIMPVVNTRIISKYGSGEPFRIYTLENFDAEFEKQFTDYEMSSIDGGWIRQDILPTSLKSYAYRSGIDTTITSKYSYPKKDIDGNEIFYASVKYKKKWEIYNPKTKLWEEFDIKSLNV